MRLRTAVVFISAVVLAAFVPGSPARADQANWPRFRGPNGQGIGQAEGIPVTWTEKDYNWKVELPGGGHSSPVIWGEKVFVTCADARTSKRIIVCLSTQDGRTLWKREYESEVCHLNSLSSYAVTTPPVDAQRVYFSWGTPDDQPIIALTHDGKEVWRADLGPFKSQHGHGPSPALLQGLLIVPSEKQERSFIAALDPETGSIRWRTDRRSAKAAYATPCVYRPPKGRPQLIVPSNAHGLSSLDPATGELNWEASKVFPLRVVSSPVIAGDLILGTCGTGGRGKSVVAVRVPQQRQGRPEVAWELKKDAPYVPTGVVHGDLIFAWHERGVVHCLRAASGEVVWRESVGGNYYGSPVRVGDRLYCISRTGDVVVVAAADQFKLLAKNPLGERSQATPAIAGGRMYLRTRSHLISIGG